MRVLFLGNSQIICNCNLPQIVRKLSESSNADIESKEVVIGGATIEKLWNDGRALAAIQNEKFDWVLYHEIVYSYGGNGERLREFGRKFHEEARKTGARMIFYASGDVNNERRTHEAMYNDAAALASECGGIAWEQYQDDRRKEKK